MFESFKSFVATLLMPLSVALLLALSAWNPVANRLLEPLERAYGPVLEVGVLADHIVVLATPTDTAQEA